MTFIGRRHFRLERTLTTTTPHSTGTPPTQTRQSPMSRDLTNAKF
jgi:hypothetical protein